MNLKFLCFGNTPKHIIIFSRSQNTLVSSMYIMQISNILQRKKLYNFTPAEKQNIHRFPAFSSETCRNTPLSRGPLHSNILRLPNLTYDCQLFFPYSDPFQVPQPRVLRGVAFMVSPQACPEQRRRIYLGVVMPAKLTAEKTIGAYTESISIGPELMQI